MTMVRVMRGIDPLTKQPIFDYVHPFLAGARRQELRVPDKHVTKKTGREIAAWRVIPREASERGGYSARTYKKEK